MAEQPAITCPHCEKTFRPKADIGGRRIKCPFCTEPFVVPGGPSTAIQEKSRASGEAGAAPQLAGAAVGGDGEENDNPYGVTHLDLAPRCPNCANEMESRDAVVCLICGYNTLTREWGKTEKLIGTSWGRHFLYLLPGFLAVFCLLGWLIDQMFYSVYLPYIVAGSGWLSWMDYEGLRMWGTMLSLGVIFWLGRYAYRRFVVKPLPDELSSD
jgi:hypothetical protein